jgi:Uncharacterized protein containing a von Willebrand factor type A (vWA) domain
MRDIFRSFDAFSKSPLFKGAPRPEKQEKTHRILKSTGIESMIYRDLAQNDNQLSELVEQGAAKLASFPALGQDLFQALYGLNRRYTEEEQLSGMAQRFNKPLLQETMDSPDYAAMKSVCQGRELPSYDAALEFTSQLANHLDSFMEKVGGENHGLELADKLAGKVRDTEEALADALEQLAQAPGEKREQKALRLANRLVNQQNQKEHVEKQVADNIQKYHKEMEQMVGQATTAAKKKAEETALAIAAWGNDPADPRQTEVNRDLLTRLHGNPKLLEITRHLGRMREILTAHRRNSYAYGLGEKYSIEFGNKLPQVLSSEFALLAQRETQILFARKLQQKRLKQYRRREPIYKGSGDIIFCKDESSSMEGDNHAWASALALTMLQVAVHERRKFVLIHFAGEGQMQTDVFEPGKYTLEDMLSSAEQFLRGGTNYATPLEEAFQLIQKEGFDVADIVFCTDGACELQEDMREQIKELKRGRKTKIIGLLIDDGQSFSFSLEPFCDEIHRLSEMTRNEVEKMMVT